MKKLTTIILASGIYLLPMSSSAIDLNQGLMAHLPLNNSAADTTGNGYDGIVHGAVPSFDRFGTPNSAYSFDGLDDSIELGAMVGFQTVSLWVKQSVRTDFDFYFGHPEYRLFASNDGGLTLTDDSQHAYTAIDMDSLEGQWVHIVAVSDGSQSKVYLNGVNVTTTSGTLAPVVERVPLLGAFPGRFEDKHYLNGALDDLRVYNRVLSDAEVTALYAIPEPATMSMLALFAGGFYFLRRLFPAY